LIARRVIGSFKQLQFLRALRPYSTYRIASAGEIFEAFLTGIIVHIMAAK
jgi:hypothetical protein